MKVGIVLPTVPGREVVFERVLQAFADTRPTGVEFDITVPEGYDNVGSAWNAGAEDVDGDYLFLAIDDAEPMKGWAQVAMQTADAGFVPAPRQEFSDGSLESCGSMGFGALLPEAPDCTPCRNAGIVFMRREWWDEIGPCADLHYSVDDLLCWKAAIAGHSLIYRSGMRFIHHHERASTEHVRRLANVHVNECIAMMATLTLPGAPASALRRPLVPA